eukprot:6187516-Pleurochrysis_carterae.AAC.2
MSMVYCRDHLLLVGVVVQAIEASAKRRRMELSASRCPVDGLFGSSMDLQNVRFHNHDGVLVVNTNCVEEAHGVRDDGLVLLTLRDLLV